MTVAREDTADREVSRTPSLGMRRRLSLAVPREKVSYNSNNLVKGSTFRDVLSGRINDKNSTKNRGSIRAKSVCSDAYGDAKVMFTLYEALWADDLLRTDRNASLKKLSGRTRGKKKHGVVDVVLPHTIVFRHGAIKAWYFTSKNGTILKRKRHNCTNKEILDLFRRKVNSPRGKGGNRGGGGTPRGIPGQGRLCNIVACVYARTAKREGGFNFHFTHVTMKQLKQFLHTEKSGDIILQKFVPPEACSNVRTYRAMWSPYVFEVEAKTSRWDPTDSKLSGTTRAATYEALDKDVSEMSFISSTTIGRTLRAACQHIVKRLETIANHRFVKSEAFKRETRRVGMIQRQEAAFDRRQKVSRRKSASHVEQSKQKRRRASVEEVKTFLAKLGPPDYRISYASFNFRFTSDGRLNLLYANSIKMNDRAGRIATPFAEAIVASPTSRKRGSFHRIPAHVKEAQKMYDAYDDSNYLQESDDEPFSDAAHPGRKSPQPTMHFPLADCGWTPFRLKLFFRKLCSSDAPPSGLSGSLPAKVPEIDVPALDLDIESIVNLYEVLFSNETGVAEKYDPPQMRLQGGLEALGVVTTQAQRDAVFEAFGGTKFKYDEADKEDGFAAFKAWMERASTREEIEFSKTLTTSDAAIITTMKRTTMKDEEASEPSFIPHVNAASRRLVQPFETERKVGETFVQAMRRAKGLPSDNELKTARRLELKRRFEAAQAPKPPDKMTSKQRIRAARKIYSTNGRKLLNNILSSSA